MHLHRWFDKKLGVEVVCGGQNDKTAVAVSGGREICLQT